MTSLIFLTCFFSSSSGSIVDLDDDDDIGDALDQVEMVPGLVVVVDDDSNLFSLFPEDDGRPLENSFPGAEDDSLSQSPKSRVG